VAGRVSPLRPEANLIMIPASASRNWISGVVVIKYTVLFRKDEGEGQRQPNKDGKTNGRYRRPLGTNPSSNQRYIRARQATDGVFFSNVLGPNADKQKKEFKKGRI
jgi:hypothetical protein